MEEAKSGKNVTRVAPKLWGLPCNDLDRGKNEC
jgi:hypothetical protein